MENILITHRGGRTRAYILGSATRIGTHMGDADVRYLDGSGYVGVHVATDANPARVDEIHAEHLIPTLDQRAA